MKTIIGSILICAGIFSMNAFSKTSERGFYSVGEVTGIFDMPGIGISLGNEWSEKYQKFSTSSEISFHQYWNRATIETYIDHPDISSMSFYDKYTNIGYSHLFNYNVLPKRKNQEILKLFISLGMAKETSKRKTTIDGVEESVKGPSTNLGKIGFGAGILRPKSGFILRGSIDYYQDIKRLNASFANINDQSLKLKLGVGLAF